MFCKDCDGKNIETQDVTLDNGKIIHGKYCMKCGYSTNDQLVGSNPMFQKSLIDTINNDSYKGMSDLIVYDEEIGQYWMPSIVQNDEAVIMPFKDENGDMKWMLARIVSIEDQELIDKGYTKTIDVDNAFVYDKFEFDKAMEQFNQYMEYVKSLSEQEENEDGATSQTE